MKHIRKIIFFVAIAFSIIIIREFVALYIDLQAISPYLAYIFLILIVTLFSRYAVIPLVKIYKFPKSFSPTKNKDEYPEILEKRLKIFTQNPLLKGYDFSKGISNEEKYREVVSILERKTEEVRNRYVSNVFYSTAVIQNGFLDSFVILTGGINMIKEIFTIYNGRIDEKGLLSLYRKLYTAVAIGGSEGVEYASDEILASFGGDMFRSIPFIDKITSSVSDGFINAILLTRISFITENYCKLIYIKSDRELSPPFKIIMNAAKAITDDMRSKLSITLKKMVLTQKDQFIKLAANPTRYVMDLANKQFEKTSEMRKNIAETVKIENNPLGFVLGKASSIFKKKKD